MDNQFHFMRCASTIYRQGNRFYDRGLSEYQIGCGQQFFLLRIYENEGISMFELASLGHFDKGTVTKGIQRLEEQGYISSEADPKDRRIRRLFTTKQALPTVEGIYALKNEWNHVLTEGLTPEEVQMAERLLLHMEKNAYCFMKQEGVPEHESRNNFAT